MGLKTRKIRIFKIHGIEVFEEDMAFIKNNEILYISEGDDYDETSNFAIYK
jgi:hypothetical protein